MAWRERCGGTEGTRCVVSFHAQYDRFVHPIVDHDALMWIYPYLIAELDVASAAWDIVFQYHGRPSGSFAADEYLAGLEAARGYVNAVC